MRCASVAENTRGEGSLVWKQSMELDRFVCAVRLRLWSDPHPKALQAMALSPGNRDDLNRSPNRISRSIIHEGHRLRLRLSTKRPHELLIGTWISFDRNAGNSTFKTRMWSSVRGRNGCKERSRTEYASLITVNMPFDANYASDTRKLSVSPFFFFSHVPINAPVNVKRERIELSG